MHINAPFCIFMCLSFNTSLYRMAMSGKVDISELTWEQKEKVLRYLFAKMNGARDKRGRTAPPSLMGSTHSMPALTQEAW